jgi:hypothetical protein
LCLYYWKITYPLHNYLAGFCLGPRVAQEARCGVRKGFGLEVESEAICQRDNLFDYIRTVILPNLAEVHALDEFAAEMGVFLTDNWSSHLTRDIINLLTEG